MTSDRSEFRPDYEQESPGAFLEWVLSTRGMKKVDLAKRCGRPTKTISEIISGKATITPDTALQFERVLGFKAAFWLRLEGEFQLSTARSRVEESDRLDKAREWVIQFPISEMEKFGFIEGLDFEDDRVQQLLRYFRVSSVASWRDFWGDRLNLARLKQTKHHSINKCAVAAWLNQGERIAESVAAGPYDEAGFKDALEHLRGLTRRPWKSVQRELLERCREVGVVVALIPDLRLTGLRGAALWATKDKAVILVSDRGKSQARVWFAFFHEAAHIILHSKKAIFVDRDKEGTAEATIEGEANDFSAELLVPQRHLEEELLRANGDLSADWLKKASSRLGVGPDLLLARLQYENHIDYRTQLKKQFDKPLVFERCEPAVSPA